MIAMLRGAIVGRAADHAVLDVHGVGYKVHLPGPALAGLPSDTELTLHISTVVREDDISLYGFEKLEQREAFDILRGVKGIGTRLSVAVLSHLDLAALRTAVAAGDIVALSRVPGVGKKTASRMVLELKDKLPVHFGPADVVPATAAPTRRGDPLPLALARLDYRKSEIDEVLAHPDVPGPDEAPVEERLSAALRVLARPM